MAKVPEIEQMPSLCYWSVCFTHLQKEDPKFFGFSEYLAAVALMALAWTIADARYKFRIATAPIPLEAVTFSVVGGVGLLTLLTDWWRAEQWVVPIGRVISPAGWQALLGLLFLANFVVWVYFAFIKPPIYGRLNASRFARELYRIVLQGSPEQLPVIADELVRSASALVRHSWQTDELEFAKMTSPEEGKKPSRRFLVRQCAYEVLLLIADKKFCRHAVMSSPVIALVLFSELRDQKRYRVPLGTFARNFTAAAIANKDSFAYHEVEGYETGIVGYAKPITTALYGEYVAIQELGDVFDVHFEEQWQWDATQWNAYCRLLLVTARDYFKSGNVGQYPPVFGRAFNDIENSVMNLGRLNGASTDAWKDDEVRKLNVAVDFVLAFIKLMDGHVDTRHVTLRRRDGDYRKDVCDLVADLMFELIFHASLIQKPRDLCWSVQHNDVWSKFFEGRYPKGTAAEIVSFKLKRQLLREVTRMDKFANFKSTRVLGMLLNVMGLKQHSSERNTGVQGLHRAVLSWTVRNYVRLVEEAPHVMETVLFAGLAYDPEGPSLVFTRERFLDREVVPVVLKLKRVAEDAELAK
ncbi:hypothetical protein [Burkholderia vietnamiensis]|uniref:hypothetical protein n=1 Tax=Burkholderia vietnamiensis TaxID=60552 RepID=UPI0018C51FD2|nr:hypothetical protein [Burkholderia vietnamiensis]MBR8188701.1 hypothetical protein [Burkholderia vietnamiensis]